MALLLLGFQRLTHLFLGIYGLFFTRLFFTHNKSMSHRENWMDDFRHEPAAWAYPLNIGIY